MKIDGTQMRWILVGVIIAVLIGMQNTIPKEATADLDDNPCTQETVKDDCPCWGKIVDETEESWGIGVGRCGDDGTCDMAYCFDVEPLQVWFEEHPLNWLNSHPEMTMLLVALLVLVIVWPKN